MKHTNRKHQWLYTLSDRELEDVAKRISGVRMTVTPAEKRLATIILKQRKEGPKGPSPAQLRVRLLGQCKFFITGADGTLTNLTNILSKSSLPDIPPYSQDKILDLIRRAKSSLVKAVAEVELQNTLLAIATKEAAKAKRKADRKVKPHEELPKA